jgi:WD40 repeat protein
VSWTRLASSDDGVVQATAAVFVGRKRTGSAVLVDERHLVTARHVLPRADRSTGVPDQGKQIEVEFPGSVIGASTPTAAARLDLGPGSAGVDVAVLRLEHPLVNGPRPVPVWPARRLPEQVAMFGYPLGEDSRGVWREFTVAGPTTDGAVQLDWAGAGGTFRGQSGGPVIDHETGDLVGILIEGSEKGRFDRFLPVTLIAQLWPDLPRRWLMTGLEGRSHFTRRGRGQRNRARGGDLFRGRLTALAEVRDWLTAPESLELPLVIIGQPGAGKSSVLARAVLDLETDRVGPGLAFHARHATHADLLDAVAALAGLYRGMSRDALLDALAEAQPSQPWRIAVDAVDEAATAQDRQQITKTLAEFATLPQTRLAVATRPLAAYERERYLPGGLLYTLGVTAPTSPNLIDLDTYRYFDPAGLAEFAAAVLTQDGAARPGPPGRAWAHYRSFPQVRDRLAQVIAARADRNYLVAAMAASPLSEALAPLDLADGGFDERAIPSGVGAALGKYLDALPEPDKSRTRGLLVALAYARGVGIEDRLWLRFSAALGYPAETADLDRLRTSTAADYLLQTVAGHTGPVTRLFHQALVDELLARRDQRSDEHRLLDVLLNAVAGAGGWPHAGEYPHHHAGEHAATADQLPRLLEDPHYLAVAEFPRLLPLLARPALAANRTATVLRRVGARATTLPPTRRARLLALTAAHLGYPDLTRRLAAACSDGIVPRWAHSLGVPHQELADNTGRPVWAVAVGWVGERQVIVSGGTDGTVRIWDADTGQPIHELTGHTSAVTAVALGRVGSREMIVSGSDDGTVRIWDASVGQQIHELTGHTMFGTTAALGRILGRDVIVSGSPAGAVRFWDAGTGQPIGELTGNNGFVRAVALGRVDDRDVIGVSADGTVRIWDAGTGQPIHELTGNNGFVRAVALGRVDDRDVIVSGSFDSTVRIWDAGTGQPIHELTGHTSPVNAVALGRVGDRIVIVSGSNEDGTVRIWDATTGQPIRELIGHTSSVNAVALGRVGDHEVIVSGGTDGTVRIWDADPSWPPGILLTSRTKFVRAVALGRVDDHEVIVSGSDDSTVRIWDAGTGQPIHELTGHTSAVTAVALGRVDDHEVIVSGSDDSTVRIWDAGTGQPIHELTGNNGFVRAVALGRVDDRDVIVSGSFDGTVRIWDAGTGQPIHELTGHTDVIAVALGRVGDREVIVSGSGDATVWIWDAGTGQPIHELTGHTSAVRAVALGWVGDRDVIVSGSFDGAVRIWDAGTGQPILELTGHTRCVTAVALGRVDDRDVIVSGSEDGTVRIWDAAHLNVGPILDTLGPIMAVGVTRDGTLCAATAHALCAFAVRA